jgi:large subunit ribosomal protein L9
MFIYMLKDVEKVGMAGQVVKVSDGYAVNYLVPKKLAKQISKTEIGNFKSQITKQKVETQVLNSKIAMLAEKIKSMHLVLKERVHDDGKLYGAISSSEIVTLLKGKGISVNKKQIEFDKSIKSVGEHKITIRLSSKLKPQLTLKVSSKEIKEN